VLVSRQDAVNAGAENDIAAAPSPVKVRQHQADGSAQEWMEQPSPRRTKQLTSSWLKFGTVRPTTNVGND